MLLNSNFYIKYKRRICTDTKFDMQTSCLLFNPYPEPFPSTAIAVMRRLASDKKKKKKAQ